MKETIYKEDAINAIKEMCLHYTPTKSEKHPHVDFVIEELMKLPSAESEIIRCRDCKYRNDYDVCPMTHVEWVEYNDDGYIESDDILYDYTQDDGFCHKAERRMDE